MATLGEHIIRCLEAYGVDTVFGIPGVHTVELYRGLGASKIRHITPRHEQGAGFMADGYARVTGRPGVAFVITGPGLTNILTPMAQAYADSVPMLVISSVNRREALGLGGGDLHEIRNPGSIAAQATAFSHLLSHPDQISSVLARAWAVFEGARPRPVHIQIPLDMLRIDVGDCPAIRGPVIGPPAPAASALDAAAALLSKSLSPLILAGGGAVSADAARNSRVATLAERLDAPVVSTVNARGIVPMDHSLSVSASPTLGAVRQAIRDADTVLALGTEFGRTDYDMNDEAPVEVPGTLIRVDIDPQQLVCNVTPTLAIVGDALDAAGGLAKRLAAPARSTGAARAGAIRDAAWREVGDDYRQMTAFLALLRDALPEAPIVGDSTNAIYAGNMVYAATGPHRWFNAATGYGALGYGFPAAIGAARGLGAPVICIAGDGGVQFTLTDIATAVEEALTVILVVVNNKGYGEIKNWMVARQISPVGVDLHTPDFASIGRAYGTAVATVDTMADISGIVRQAAERGGPTLIEIDEKLILDREI